MRAMLALICAPAFATPVILNPSFENGTNPGVFLTVAGGGGAITDGTVTGNSVDYIGTYWQTAQGSRSVDLNGSGVGGLQQAIPGFAIGATYGLGFYMSGNPDGAPPVKNLRVNVSGIGDFDFTFNTAGFNRTNMGWELKTVPFIATATNHTITFTSLDSIPAFYGAAVDNLSLSEDLSTVPAPEPASFALLGAGLLAVSARRRGSKREGICSS